MKRTILLKSRYGEIHKLERIGGKDSRLFLFVPDNNYYILGLSDHSPDDFLSVDPTGGPSIHVGAKLDEANAIIKSIRNNKEGKIVIEFE